MYIYIYVYTKKISADPDPAMPRAAPGTTFGVNPFLSSSRCKDSQQRKGTQP